jgi:tetratricopeptide (TPR) repeat protein
MKSHAEDGEIEALRNVATNMGQTGDFGLKAMRINTRILELAPDDFAARVRRGKCHKERDNFPAAREDYLHALRIAPGHSFVESELREIEADWHAARQRAEARAERERRQGEKERARKEARAAEFRSIGATTSFWEARAVGIAASEGRYPDYPIAAAALERAAELKPDNSEVLTRLARVYRFQKNLDAAEETYRRALKLDNSRFAKVGLAAVLQDKVRPTEALDLYEEVLSRYPRDAYALRGSGRTLASLGRNEEATLAFQKAGDEAKNQKERAAIRRELTVMRDRFSRAGDTERARWVDSMLDRLGEDRTSPG